MRGFVAELEERARRRFVRWDAALWERLLDGPARSLASALTAAGADSASSERLLESYLHLACEGLGLGYLFPPEVGDGFLNRAFFEWIPQGLPALPAERREQVLAEAWNLGENLEQAPAWWRRLFTRLAADGASLGSLAGLVERISREVLAPPAERLGSRLRLSFVDLGAEERRMLPGALHFVAPTVVCVHDRDLPARTVGAWLVDPPLVLGAMGCTAEPARSAERRDVIEDLARRDPRVSDVLNAAANAWRVVSSLETSQFLVAVYPS